MIQVWDLATRLYHWGQALLVTWMLLSGFSGNGDSIGHMAAGVALLVLVCWRLIWGIWGSETARFRAFIPSPSQLISYLISSRQERPGHNPLGALMVVLLLCLLCSQLLSGWLISPLSPVELKRSVVRLLEHNHGRMALGLVIAVSVHVLAVTVYQWRGHRLIQAMITGKQHGSGAVPKLVAGRKAAMVLALSASGVSLMMVISLF
ncbi:cytochrome b/b6 domain-containing protein [Ferrimonas sp. SCSIO 43195]|uniref:cytochrome b/b6 domain-containing protein n=1 Tax=Ferrimonas sp. SCSIO 43195 TaxID=2822844 RepID=UPI002075A343|nr:cytochrome b/b6 domain-containing protein [Ferrimonas sp. SCSIO 43195]USD39230.1 cytochrome b/b6 domain-containing protein [Ferrimonas sp. SCSIO 43195]